ncbi:hypothetical protein BDQ17DRAFT_1509744 [Cyathus striatus]|nr:hypothetical protein BDQ17DRAFT_1509744 [Cyathus striatus]
MPSSHAKLTGSTHSPSSPLCPLVLVPATEENTDVGWDPGPTNSAQPTSSTTICIGKAGNETMKASGGRVNRRWSMCGVYSLPCCCAAGTGDVNNEVWMSAEIDVNGRKSYVVEATSGGGGSAQAEPEVVETNDSQLPRPEGRSAYPGNEIALFGM